MRIINGFIVFSTYTPEPSPESAEEFYQTILETWAKRNHVNVESIRQRMLHMGTIEAAAWGIDLRLLNGLQNYIRSTSNEKVRIVKVSLNRPT